jgi:hypothetical protein
MPRPKKSAQYRLTMTRAVSGCCGSSSHVARPSRFFGSVSGNGRSRAGVPGSTRLGRRVVRAAIEDEGRTRLRQLAHHHHLRQRGEHGVLLAPQRLQLAPRGVERAIDAQRVVLAQRVPFCLGAARLRRLQDVADRILRPRAAPRPRPP